MRICADCGVVIIRSRFSRPSASIAASSELRWARKGCVTGAASVEARGDPRVGASRRKVRAGRERQCAAGLQQHVLIEISALMVYEALTLAVVRAANSAPN